MIGVLILFFFSPISQTIFRLKKWRSKGTYYFFHTQQMMDFLPIKFFLNSANHSNYFAIFAKYSVKQNYHEKIVVRITAYYVFFDRIVELKLFCD